MKNTEKLARENNRDYALRVIRENIINLELKPGSMISEQDIAEELHLSRTPVHEALQELARTKIIEIMPQKGSLVSLVDMNRVDEAVFMRATIESAVTEEASKLATDADIAQMEANIKLQQFYNETKAIEKLLEVDNQFHELMYKITNKMQCFYMVRLMNIHYDRFREMKMHTVKGDPIIEEHIEILNAVKSHDPERAKAALLKHINRLYLDVVEIKNNYPDYFA
ncbi:MAG: GntR family transcriptional regulator [Treponemataceae bacterium]|nr:GntR family transcriptional regulator [Treponemataceae bacterium]